MSVPTPGPSIESVEASAFTIPAEQPEQDGTLEWSQNTLLLVQARAAMGRAVRSFGQTGLVPTAVSAVDVALWDLKAHGTREITHQEQ